jgi:hypothetical protein
MVENSFGSTVGAPADTRSRLEQQIASMWAEALGVDCVGLHENFFGLGGHPLLAAAMTNQLTQVLGVSVPVRSIF